MTRRRHPQYPPPPGRRVERSTAFVRFCQMYALCAARPAPPVPRYQHGLAHGGPGVVRLFAIRPSPEPSWSSRDASKTLPRRSRDALRSLVALPTSFSCSPGRFSSENGAQIVSKRRSHLTKIGRRPRSESQFARFSTGPLRSCIIPRTGKSCKSLVRVIKFEGVAFAPRALECDRN